MSDIDEQGSPRFRIATLNVRNTADRWRERREVLVAQLAELRPDVIGVQELRRRPSQVRWITRRLNKSLPLEVPYRHHSTGKTGLWGLWEGIALLSRLPIVARGSLDLGGEHRVANWVRVRLLDGAVLEVHNAHLSSRDERLRDNQARLIIDHLATRGETPTLLVGDLNAGPASSTLRVLGERLRSAYTLVNGEEPRKTWPTALRPGTAHGSVIDYILVDDHLEVVEAWQTFDRPAPSDPTLFPSDHVGIAATVRVRPR
ncbi:MAG TPA: endonuclease/exonuclease/phosphatase family protein [Acidimicrobiales bacterium]|nr:endonuclease/exonuclease/phosphatase family protein [Acidimicrobiales bacterium]